MTTTACLPECMIYESQDIPASISGVIHSRLCPNCPRAPQAEAPDLTKIQCNCGRSPLHPVSAHIPAPQAEDGGKVHGDDCVDDCNGCACWCHPFGHLYKSPEPKQGSEEPIDWDAAKASSESWAKGRPLPHDLKCTPAQETLGRAYVALRAEVENWRNESLPAKLIDALRTENERLYGKVQGHGLVLAERDTLRAEVEDLKRKIEVLESDRGRGASPDPRP